MAGLGLHGSRHNREVEGKAGMHSRLERSRGMPYPVVLARVKEIMEKLPEGSLVADQTGVGALVVDMFRQADSTCWPSPSDAGGLSTRIRRAGNN